ncbi:MAG: RagB/SusD family nutrient uptake outer membrane protein [Rikenellaceae bacterium]|nr:RagB/SusD family nutrient uptake outer membrane protein [Rikenellaceae bacterium]
MKQIIDKILRLSVVLAVTAAFTSCLENYLERDPGTGFSEKDVFTNYQNFKNYFYSIYHHGGTNGNDGDPAKTAHIKAFYPFYWALNDQKMSLEMVTDMVEGCRNLYSQPPKRGEDSQGFADRVGYYGDRKKVSYGWSVIRVCNMVLENIDMLEDVTESEKNDFIGQAYFVRAFVHFELFRLYGTLPYIDHVLGSDDEWDLPRLEVEEFIGCVTDDFDTAYDYLRRAGAVRRDPATGTGHLNAPDQDKPNGAAAKAFKSRALLYLASPLNNPGNEARLWQQAAAASWEAIQVALDNGYALLDFNDYTLNFYGTTYTNEQIWAYSFDNMPYSNSGLQTFIPYVFSNDTYSSGQAPTENFVSRFETIDGYPLTTQAERETAARESSSGWNELNNPYVDRDPRLDVIVIYNQKPLDGYGNASLYIYPDGSKPGESLLLPTNTTPTGYFECKRTGKLARNSSVTSQRFTDPLIRLAELYLNYAEAANEAYGPNTPAPGAALTAVEALNVVRHRVGMPDVLAKFTGSADDLRPRIKNERTVELCFEGHHYFCDIRRWKDAPEIMSGRLYGIQAVYVNYDRPGETPVFEYSRYELDSDRQVAWKNGMYYVPFKNSDLVKMKNYVPNESW